MQPILKFFKALYNFLVGDWIILGGVALVLVLVALLENLPALAGVKGAGGYLLILGLIITLALTLRRETHP